MFTAACGKEAGPVHYFFPVAGWIFNLFYLCVCVFVKPILLIFLKYWFVENKVSHAFVEETFSYNNDDEFIKHRKMGKNNQHHQTWLICIKMLHC